MRIGSLLPDLAAPMDIELRSGAKLTLEPLARNGHRIGVSNFDPCLVLLNNDLSSGLPEILRDLEQAVLPPLHAGWFMRRKSNHFAAYNEIAAEFAQLIGIDTALMYKIAFALGVGLTAFGGAVILPYATVFPGVGGQFVVLMFTVVVLGGLGSVAAIYLVRDPQHFAALALGLAATDTCYSSGNPALRSPSAQSPAM